ncbi:hypothetical protein SDC9_192255 [bioreactor metagenome]|uniref:Uncharacterized protein n=1 Tax=bioreactor metagenome TaxID=1076179 RepID=A0A645I0L2_9ZZZZ
MLRFIACALNIVDMHVLAPLYRRHGKPDDLAVFGDVFALLNIAQRKLVVNGYITEQRELLKLSVF